MVLTGEGRAEAMAIGMGIYRSHLNQCTAEGSARNESVSSQGIFTPQKRNPTLSVSNTAANPGLRSTVKFTAPPNSRSILANSSATHRSPLPASLSNLSMDWSVEECEMKLSWIADMRGGAVGLRVERAVGIQRISPPIQSTPKFTSRRVGNLEKSKVH